MLHGKHAHSHDELRVDGEVLEVRPSKSRPEQGLVEVRTNTLSAATVSPHPNPLPPAGEGVSVALNSIGS